MTPIQCGVQSFQVNGVCFLKDFHHLSQTEINYEDSVKIIVLQKPYRSKDTDSRYTAYYLMNIHAGQ